MLPCNTVTCSLDIIIAPVYTRQKSEVPQDKLQATVKQYLGGDELTKVVHTPAPVIVLGQIDLGNRRVCVCVCLCVCAKCVVTVSQLLNVLQPFPSTLLIP
jgi:hypothetical protein